MLDSIMTFYYKVRHGLIDSLSGTDGISYEEVRFYDLGYMQTQLNHIKRELESVEARLSDSIRNEASTGKETDYRNDLLKKREMLIFHMIFTLSNSFSNLEKCRLLADGHNFKFMTCVEGLDEYRNGDKTRAFELIEGYYKEYGNFEDHFLLNKVYGLLLIEKGLFEKAIPFLSYALGFMPDDRESLSALDSCFENTGNEKQREVLADISKLLGY